MSCVTRRLGVIAALGLVAVLAAAGFAAYAHRRASEPAVSPTWGVFTDAQWQTLGERLGVATSELRMVTAMPARDGTPFAIVSATLSAGRRCFVVVRGLRPGDPICKLDRPLMAFTTREPHGIDVVGLASRRVGSLVSTWRLPDGRTTTSGSALLSAPGAWGFGSSYSGTLVALTARDVHDRVIARLYCASALRGVCGMSAQRRS
jgi:hypothetical protein